MPPRRPTLKKSLRAIERAFADIESLFAGLVVSGEPLTDGITS